MADPQASFAAVKFFQQLGNPINKIDASWAEFTGRKSLVETFYVDGTPQPGAYILLQLYNVTDSGHGILINGQVIQNVDIPPLLPSAWAIWMDVFSAPLLKTGPNTIQIVGGDHMTDNFIIGSVVIHWMQTAA